MKFKAVLFDLDGTLLDTLDDLAESMNAVLAGSGYPVHEVEAYKYFVGNGVRKLTERCLPEGHRSILEIDDHLAQMLKEYEARWDNKSKPYKGISELLDTLTEKGVKMAILTNKADEFAGRIVKKLLPDWSFQAVIGEKPTLPKKPDPAGAVKIAELFGLPCSEFLYLGDTDVDMKTAVSAGMYAVGALWGFRKADELVEGGARVLIPEPLALLDLL
jgi:phosphoglycolate phosphatase